jgi:hypothetical protein
VLEVVQVPGQQEHSLENRLSIRDADHFAMRTE